MKNPLVDALRLASGTKTLDDASEAVVVDDIRQESIATANENHPSEWPADGGDLELLESTGALLVGETDEECDTGELPIIPHDAHSVTQQLYLTAHAAERPVPEIQRTRTFAMRAGRWSPVLFVALFCAAAAGYWMYEALKGGYENADLQSLSGQAGPNREELSQIVTNKNPFQLIVNTDAASSNEGSSKQ